ncbi:hypothetical protein NNC19_18060 [Clostridium sp. SHJSY1]|uniref:hypothetical protein n=1 Tax=Clostridium sp. SHJSY1 TaxID=2942483 RepID=UPI00287500F3|nr:hypothetical protein [Clostridium sp. SHJSY1]MDS0527598.1 hypothetical protein [Clostridium sp. SHJSY1]
MVNNKIFNLNEKKVDEKIKQVLNGFRNIIGEPHKKQEKFIEQIVRGLYTDCEFSKVNVVPVRCGFGKTLAIKLFLKGLVENKTKEDKLDGVIVVTDKLERLKEIKEFDGLEEMCMLIKYQDEVNCTLDEEKYILQLKKQSLYPILLMSTQKYERLSKKQREQFYRWKNGARRLVIFDEKPCIYNQTTIDVEYMSDIKKEIDKIEENEDKQILLKEFRNAELKLEEIKDYLKDINEIMWFRAREDDLFDKENKFINIAEKMLNADVLYRISKLIELYKNGGLFVNKKNKKMENKRFFILLKDNTIEFDTDSVKYWVFDATAKIDVEYSYSDKFNFIEVDDSKEENLKILHVNQNMSKQSIKANSYMKIKVLNEFIKNRIHYNEPAIIASHKEVKSKIEVNTDKHIKLYFGNIKGSNAYRDITKMMHVGWNRQPDYHYIGLYLLMDKNRIKAFNVMTEEELKIEINELKKLKKGPNGFSGSFENKDIDDIMLSKILCDFEQNIFRTKIRNFSSKEEIIIYIFIDGKNNELIDMIEKRYNINIEYLSSNEFLKYKVMSRNNKKISVAQKIMDWWENHTWTTELEIAEILRLNGVKQNQFDKAKEKNKSFREFISNHACDKRCYYHG